MLRPDTFALTALLLGLGTGACLFGEEPARIYRAQIEGEEVVVTA